LISTEESLAAAIRDAAPTEGYPRVPSADAFVAENSKGLADRPAFRAEFSTQVHELIDGAALDIESLVDILTLKDVSPSRASDAAIALQRLTRAHLPKGRKQVALLSIWRRVYLATDWRDIARTAGRSEQAQRRLIQQSWVYATLVALKRTDVPPNYVLLPSQATAAPLPEEIAARYPAYAGDRLDALMADHEQETALLENLLADEAVGLDDRVKAIMRLIEHGDEIVAEVDVQDSDVDM
jgi:nuclear pore complex protein Nup133